jgi:hypothetical protein
MIMRTSAKSVLISPGVGDALHALEQDVVGHLERVQQRRLLVSDVEQPVVRDDDERVDLLADSLDAALGLHRAAAPFEAERTRDDGDRERAQAAGDLGHDRCATGTGAAAFTRGDEHHVGALEHLFDLVAVVLGRLAADLRVGARTQAAGELAADVELHVGVAQQQRLGVGVDRHELDAFEAGVDHPVDGVAAPAANTSDLDHRQVVLRVAQHVGRPFDLRPGTDVVAHVGGPGPGGFAGTTILVANGGRLRDQTGVIGRLTQVTAFLRSAKRYRTGGRVSNIGAAHGLTRSPERWRHERRRTGERRCPGP